MMQSRDEIGKSGYVRLSYARRLRPTVSPVLGDTRPAFAKALTKTVKARVRL